MSLCQDTGRLLCRDAGGLCHNAGGLCHNAGGLCHNAGGLCHNAGGLCHNAGACVIRKGVRSRCRHGAGVRWVCVMVS